MAGKILAWIKGHLLIVVSGVLIIVLPAAGWYFSSSWNASIREQAQSAFQKEQSALRRVSSVDYALPAVLEGEENITESRAPNPVVTEFYANQREQRERQVDAVVERGVAFNMENHEVPVEGILPEAENDRELRRLGRILGERIAGTEETPSLYATLLRRLNAGDAPDPEALADQLERFREQQEQTLAASSPDGQLSDEQRAQIDQELVRRRLNEYASRAESLGFYCATREIQSTEPIQGYSHVPAEPPSLNAVTPARVYNWVWDWWVISDVLRAVSLANTDDAGVALAVPDAPVKRVEFIGVDELVLAGPQTDDPAAPSQGRSTRGGRGSPQIDPAQAAQASGPGTFTARSGGRAGSPYDIRYVDLTIVAASDDLPRFIDALGKTNYMTVVDLDLERLDPITALQAGYFYGDDHVVRAAMRIETVWLRAWTADYMPDEVKQALGVPVETPEGEG